MRELGGDVYGGWARVRRGGGFGGEEEGWEEDVDAWWWRLEGWFGVGIHL